MDAKLLMQLRERTGAPITACQQVLVQTNGDIEKAADILKKKGLEVVAKKADREASEGLVDAYIHPNGKVGALVQVACETDFVARTEEFQEFVHDLALQIAASDPCYVGVDNIPANVLAKQRESWTQEVAGMGKPPAVAEQIIKGKLEKWFTEVCLLKQAFLKNEDITVQELLQEKIAKMGENIKIKRFTRFSF